jgi:hypothetical protein
LIVAVAMTVVLVAVAVLGLGLRRRGWSRGDRRHTRHADGRLGGQLVDASEQRVLEPGRHTVGVDERGRVRLKLPDVARLRAVPFADDPLAERDQRGGVGVGKARALAAAAPRERERCERDGDDAGVPRTRSRSDPPPTRA